MQELSNKKRPTYKFLIIGDSSVGKTSILIQFCEQNFHSEHLSTIGVDFKTKQFEIDGKFVNLNIWDTAGQQKFRNITKSFYKGANGIILVYAINNISSFQHIQQWVEQIRQAGNPQCQLILVGSKKDLENNRVVSEANGQQLANKYKMSFIQCSAKKNININIIFQLLTRKVVDKIGTNPHLRHHTHKMVLTQQQMKNKHKKNCC